MFKWPVFPMFVVYCVGFAIAGCVFGPKALILPAAEIGILGTMLLAFNRVEKNERQRISASK